MEVKKKKIPQAHLKMWKLKVQGVLLTAIVSTPCYHIDFHLNLYKFIFLGLDIFSVFDPPMATQEIFSTRLGCVQTSVAEVKKARMQTKAVHIRFIALIQGKYFSADSFGIQFYLSLHCHINDNECMLQCSSCYSFHITLHLTCHTTSCCNERMSI